VSFKRGAVIPLGLATASAALFDALGLLLPTTRTPAREDSRDSALLVWGGSSSVGSNTVQLGRRLGFTVIATASPVHHANLKSLGATAVFDYHLPTVVDDIVAAAEKAGKPIKYAVDAVSLPASLEPSVKALEKSGGGKLGIVLGWPTDRPKPKGVEVLQVASRRILEKKQIAKWVFGDFLTASLEDGSFQPSPEARLVEGGLGGLQTGLDLLKKGVSGTKIVVELE
jgi:NADPH:quinone reductase-like Zn-dependent oxidoreductase